MIFETKTFYELSFGKKIFFDKHIENINILVKNCFFCQNSTRRMFSFQKSDLPRKNIVEHAPDLNLRAESHE